MWMNYNYQPEKHAFLAISWSRSKGVELFSQRHFKYQAEIMPHGIGTSKNSRFWLYSHAGRPNNRSGIRQITQALS
jgi:hypothetical protein